MKRKSFKEAVKNTSDVSCCYMEGKKAILNSERNKVELADDTRCGGSLFIDKCLADQKKYPNDNRWDYAIDYCGEVYFVEVHTASDGEVSNVIKKLEWLKSWLQNSASEINLLKASAPYFWIQSNGYHISKNSTWERRAIQKGIKPVSKLTLK